MDRVDQYSDPQLEKMLLSVLLRENEAAVQYFPRLLPKHFTDENVIRLFTLARRFTLRSGSVLTREALRVELGILYPTKPDIIGSILGMYDQLIVIPQTTPSSFLVDRLVNFARTRDMLVSIKRSVELLDDGRMDDSLRVYGEGAFAMQMADPNVFITRGEVIQDFEKRKALIADMKRNPDKYRGIPTGIDDLDRVTGGLWDGELGFCFGKTGVGKSFFLLQAAYHAYLSDKQVLVIPVEMPLIQWQRRFDARISKVAYDQFKWATITESEIMQWERCILRSRDAHYDKGARVFITHMPIGSPISGVRAELELLHRQDVSVDLLVVDYATLLAPLRSARSQQEEYTLIFQELKAIATSYGIPIWTAAQLRRESYRSERLTAEGVGYAMGTVHVSDMAVGISKSDTDTLQHRLFLSIAKYRDGTFNRLITCRPNFALAMIHDAL